MKKVFIIRQSDEKYHSLNTFTCICILAAILEKKYTVESSQNGTSIAELIF